MTYGKAPNNQRPAQSQPATGKARGITGTPKTDAPQTSRSANVALAQEKRALEVLESAPAGKGFDPYNSGAFDKRSTWERVIRK